MLPSLDKSARPFPSQAFTLVEILVVIAIIVVLMAGITPALQVVGARGMSHSINRVADVVSEARFYAMANNTYVWVGFTEQKASAPDGTVGTGRVMVGIVASKNGNDVGSTGSSLPPDSLIQVAKVVGIDNVSIQIGIPPSGAPPQIGPESKLATAPTSTTFYLPLSGVMKYSFEKVIRINPLGEIELGAGGTTNDRWIEIGLEQTKGDVRLASGADFAAIHLATLTGRVAIYH